MKTKKILCIFVIILLAISITSVVYAKEIECKNFKITIPDGYKKTDNYDDIEHTDYLYISTGVTKDSGSICIQELGQGGKTKEYSGLDSNYLKDKEVEKTENIAGGFAEKCRSDGHNFTYAEFETGGYTYGVIVDHDRYSNYDDAMFQKDISAIESISSSLYRK